MKVQQFESVGGGDTGAGLSVSNVRVRGCTGELAKFSNSSVAHETLVFAYWFEQENSSGKCLF
jgi:hypothetical protein